MVCVKPCGGTGVYPNRTGPSGTGPVSDPLSGQAASIGWRYRRSLLFLAELWTRLFEDLLLDEFVRD